MEHVMKVTICKFENHCRFRLEIFYLVGCVECTLLSVFFLQAFFFFEIYMPLRNMFCGCHSSSGTSYIHRVALHICYLHMFTCSVMTWYPLLSVGWQIRYPNIFAASITEFSEYIHSF